MVIDPGARCASGESVFMIDRRDPLAGLQLAIRQLCYCGCGIASWSRALPRFQHRIVIRTSSCVHSIVIELTAGCPPLPLMPRSFFDGLSYPKPDDRARDRYERCIALVMSKQARPLRRAKKQIRKAVRKNPLMSASLIALGGIATYVAGNRRVRERTRELKDAVVHRLSGMSGFEHGQEAHTSQTSA